MLIGQFCRAATAEFEQRLRRTFVEASHTERRTGNGSKRLRVRNTPLTALTSVTFDKGLTSEELQTASDFEFFSDGVINLHDDSDLAKWPTAPYRSIEIVYVGGYDVTTSPNNWDNATLPVDPWTVPQDLEEAALMVVGLAWKRWSISGEATLGVMTRSRGAESMVKETFIKGLPKEVLDTLRRYRPTGRFG